MKTIKQITSPKGSVYQVTYDVNKDSHKKINLRRNNVSLGEVQVTQSHSEEPDKWDVYVWEVLDESTKHIKPIYIKKVTVKNVEDLISDSLKMIIKKLDL